MTGRLREIRAALAHGASTTFARPRNTLLTVAGFLIAAATLLGLLTIPSGLGQLASRTGLADVAVLMPTGHAASGGLTDAQQIGLIGDLPGVAHGARGDALVAPQFTVKVKLRRFNGSQSDVMIRGVPPSFWQVVGGSAHVVHGGMFKPGLRQLIAGVGVARTFAALDTGAHVLVRGVPWHVSGEFAARGSLWQSELWTDLGSLQAAWNAPNRVNEIWVKLVSPGAFRQFDAALSANGSLGGWTAVRQTDYYRFQIGFIYRFARIAAWGIAILLGAAAILAIANALNMALMARRRETAVFRALGFRRANLAAAMLIEVVVTSLVCACIVIAVGWLALNGRVVSSATFSQSVDFSLHVGPAVAVQTLAYTVALGVLASAWPIRRAVHAPLTRALQGE